MGEKLNVELSPETWEQLWRASGFAVGALGAPMKHKDPSGKHMEHFAKATDELREQLMAAGFDPAR